MSGIHQYAQVQGDAGVVVLYVLATSPGASYPVVIGGGGSGGGVYNVISWNDNMNGGDGGASSFGGVAAPGGLGGKLIRNVYAQLTNSGYTPICPTNAGYVSNGCAVYRGAGTNLDARGVGGSDIFLTIGRGGHGGMPALRSGWGEAGQSGFVGVFW